MSASLWSSLPPATKAKPTHPSKVQYRDKIPTAGGLGPRSDHQWSPRRRHVQACCMVGGMDCTKHNNARGPLTSSAVHQIIKTPPHPTPQPVPPSPQSYTHLHQNYYTINKLWTSPHDCPISNTTWSVNMGVHRTPSRLPSVTTVDYTYLVLL